MDFFSVENLIAFLTLSALEIVLGIDNIVFIAIISNALPAEIQSKARRIGLLLAMGTRILLLLAITWVMGLTAPIFSILSHVVTGRDIVLLAGGLFLVAKSTFEIHEKMEAPNETANAVRKVRGFTAAVTQIAILDIVFSLDSVITAVGMVDQIWVMVAAVVTSVGVMLFAARPIGEFVDKHPSVKVLALAFLVMVGMALMGEAFDMHVPKGYIYTAMAFSLAVEALNIRAHKRRNSLRRAAEGG